jgi:hypothetical protein
MTPEVTHTKLWVELPHEIYVYFFRKVFAGDRGIKQQLSLRFYQALYAECQRQGIPGEWDPDNYQKINDIMSKLNFNDDRPARSRRPASSPSKHKTQPASGGDDPRPTNGTHQKAPDPGDQPSDPIRPS